MHFHVVTLFPESMRAYLACSIMGRAIEKGHIFVSYYNPLDFSEDSKFGALPRRIDDKPYGGGPGMVMRPEPIVRAIASAVGHKRNYLVIHFAPRAEKFTTEIAREIAGASMAPRGSLKNLIFVCGRYEGIDSRVNEIYPGRTFSIGDYVLTGGELPALTMIDCITRQLPGVLGDSDSREEERIAAGKYYTRPERLMYKGKRYDVPRILLEGDHKRIQQWKSDNQ